MSTSCKPAAVIRFASLGATLKSLRSSKARIYRLLHSRRACRSVMEPLSDCTLKYISAIWTQPPRFVTLFWIRYVRRICGGLLWVVVASSSYRTRSRTYDDQRDRSSPDATSLEWTRSKCREGKVNGRLRLST